MSLILLSRTAGYPTWVRENSLREICSHFPLNVHVIVSEEAGFYKAAVLFFRFKLQLMLNCTSA